MGVVASSDFGTGFSTGGWLSWGYEEELEGDGKEEEFDLAAALLRRDEVQNYEFESPTSKARTLEKSVPTWDIDEEAPGLVQKAVKMLRLEPLLAKEKELPEWAYDATAGDLFWSKNGAAAPAPPLSYTSGPGVHWAFLGVANYWFYTIAQPMLTYALAECPEDGGFAEAPEVLSMALMAVVAAIACVIQLKCMRYAILPQLAIAKKFEFMGIPFNKFHYGVFMLFMSGLTGVNLMDNMTNAAVLGKAMATRKCQSYPEIAEIWNEVLMASPVFAYIPYFTGIDFGHVALACYGALFLQLVYALLCAVPVEKGVTYKVATGHNQKFYYPTFINHFSDHGQVLMTLAQSARFEAVVFQDFEYAKSKMELCMEAKTSQWEYNYFNMAVVEFSRATARFWLVGVLQTAVQLNFQLSLAALGAYATGVIDTEIISSVVLSLVCYLPDFPDAFEILELGREARRHITHENVMAIEDKAYRRKVFLERKLFMRKLICLHIYVAIYAMFLMYAIYKLIGLYTCPHYLINVTGCV